MMRKTLIFRGLVLPAALLLALLLSVSAIASPLGDECEMYGSILVDGHRAQVGTELVAVIGTEEVARTTVQTEGTYEITIPKRDADDPESKGYSSESDLVTIYVDGRKAEPSFNPTPNRTKLDIKVSTTLEVKQTTWGKIKALFK